MSQDAFWLVAKTKPNSEQIALRNIKNQLFEYYFPRIQVKKAKRKKTVLVEQPLFPGYLFVKINPLQHWTSLKYTYGVHSVIMASQKVPATVPEAILEDLRAREDQQGFIVLPAPRRLLEGDTVTIKSGPFHGHRGLVEKMNGKERQRVLLALLGNQIRVLVDESDLDVVMERSSG